MKLNCHENFNPTPDKIKTLHYFLHMNVIEILYFIIDHLGALLSLLLGLLDGDDLAILQGADCGNLAAVRGRLIEGFSELQ